MEEGNNMAISIKEAYDKKSIFKYRPMISELIDILDSMSFNSKYDEEVLDDVKHMIRHLRLAEAEFDQLLDDMKEDKM